MLSENPHPLCASVALLFAIRAESFSHSLCFFFFAKMYAIWVINEHLREYSFEFDSIHIGNTQNGSPFVIRDVFMCFRSENQSRFSERKKKQNENPKGNVVLVFECFDFVLFSSSSYQLMSLLFQAAIRY